MESLKNMIFIEIINVIILIMIIIRAIITIDLIFKDDKSRGIRSLNILIHIIKLNNNKVIKILIMLWYVINRR